MLRSADRRLDIVLFFALAGKQASMVFLPLGGVRLAWATLSALLTGSLLPRADGQSPRLLLTRALLRQLPGPIPASRLA